MIEVNALKNGLTLNETERLTSGSVNVYYVHFHFSSHWDGLEKVAIFRNSLTSINVPVVDDIAVIPWEVTTTVGLDVRMGVCGIKAGEIVLPTIWATLGKVVEGAKIANAESGDHTPDIYDLILQKIQEFIDGLDEVWSEFDNVYDEIPTNDEITSIVLQYFLQRPDLLYPIIKQYLTDYQTAIENDIRTLIKNYLNGNKSDVERGIESLIDTYFSDNPETIEKIVADYLSQNSTAIGDIIQQYIENNSEFIEEIVTNYLTNHPPTVDENTVAGLIEDYFESNPVDTMTEDEVKGIIQQYLTENQVGVTEERVQEMIDETVGSAIRSGY